MYTDATVLEMKFYIDIMKEALKYFTFLVITTQKALPRTPCLLVYLSLQHYVLYPLLDKHEKEKLKKEIESQKWWPMYSLGKISCFKITVIGNQINT